MNIEISKLISNVEASVTLSLSAKAAEMKTQGVDVCSFTAGEPDFDTPEHIRKAVADAVSAGGKVCKYTPVPGMPELREVVAQKFKNDNGLNYDSTQVVIGTGAKQIIYNALAALVNPGNEVLFAAPYWVSYPQMTNALGGKPVSIDCTMNENFAPSADQIRAHVNDRTKALILCSPSNPSGTVFAKSQLEEIYSALEGTNVIVISDEIYEHLVYDGSEHVSPASISEDAYERTITVNGMSKSFAMTGWRIGFGGGPLELIKAMSRFQSHTTSNPTTPSQIATLAALQGDQACIAEMRSAFDERRQAMVSLLNAIDGVECEAPKGAFYAFPKVSGLYGKGGLQGSSDFSSKLLEVHAVATIPGVAFGADDFVRMSYATSMEVIEKGIGRLAEFAKSL